MHPSRSYLGVLNVHILRLYCILLQMPTFAQLDKPPTSYDDRVIGHAKSIDDLQSYYNNMKNFYGSIILSLSFCIAPNVLIFKILNQSIKMKLKRATIFHGDMIKRRISTHKPKLYYHFWSALILLSPFVCIKLLTYFQNPQNVLIFVAFLINSLIAAIVNTLYGYLFVVGSFTAPLKDITFTVPMTVLFTGKNCCCYLCCSSCCSKMIQFFMTFTAMFFVNFLLLYLLCAIPTIVFVYYLYPTRTLIRVPFIITALFYTIALGACVLYLTEKFAWVWKPGHQSRQTIHSLVDRTRTVDGQRHRECFRPEEDIPLEVKHYQEILNKGLKEYFMLYFLGVLLELVVFIFILILYVFGELKLAELVFEKSDNLTHDSDISSLLILIPTIILSLGTWYGHGLFFDLKKDLKEMEEDELTEQKKSCIITLRNRLLKEGCVDEYLVIGQYVPGCCTLFSMAVRRAFEKWRDYYNKKFATQRNPIKTKKGKDDKTKNDDDKKDKTENAHDDAEDGDEAAGLIVAAADDDDNNQKEEELIVGDDNNKQTKVDRSIRNYYDDEQSIFVQEIIVFEELISESLYRYCHILKDDYKDKELHTVIQYAI